MNTPFEETVEKVDLCVVGGGIAGMLAAIAAARHGASVALMHDRPVLGGNASSEIRMWLCGCAGRNNHETGIIEDLQLDNCFFNPGRNFSIWDTILFGAVRGEPRISLYLNCSCNSAKMDGGRIVSVTGWQTTTQKWRTVEAALFADCSGDSVLAPLTGADFRVGREAREEFGESLAQEEADRRTMGMSCLIQARETTMPVPFTPPPWAHSYPDASMLKPSLAHFNPHDNYWWLELGGMGDSIADTESVRDELLRTALGVWDHYKNHSDGAAANWALDWLGFLPGKRESRRLMGDLILTQGDITECRTFPDAVAYGGWPLDDHDPHGFEGKTPSNVSIPVRRPYQIPYRCLYSRNVENLFFAGRNISVSHVALSSARVMCTCGIVGQAVGTAAAIAARHGETPRGVFERHVDELRQTLLDDDCHIPGARRAVPAAALEARLEGDVTGDIEDLRSGIDRPVGDADNGVYVAPDGSVANKLGKPARVESARIVLDSDLARLDASKHNIRSNYAIAYDALRMPAPLVRDLRLESRGADGAWRLVARITDNRRRLVRIPVGAETTGLRLVPGRTWGGTGPCHVFAFDFR
jgi:hypothetical protein